MISTVAPAIQPFRAVTAKRPQAVQFKGDPPHVHGPDCNHGSHHHTHAAKPEQKKQNPIVQFLQSIYDWFKDFFTGLWQDLFGTNKEEEVTSPVAPAPSPTTSTSNTCADNACADHNHEPHAHADGDKKKAASQPHQHKADQHHHQSPGPAKQPHNHAPGSSHGTCCGGHEHGHGHSHGHDHHNHSTDHQA